MELFSLTSVSGWKGSTDRNLSSLSSTNPLIFLDYFLYIALFSINLHKCDWNLLNNLIDNSWGESSSFSYSSSGSAVVKGSLEVLCILAETTLKIQCTFSEFDDAGFKPGINRLRHFALLAWHKLHCANDCFHLG